MGALSESSTAPNGFGTAGIVGKQLFPNFGVAGPQMGPPRTFGSEWHCLPERCPERIGMVLEVGHVDAAMSDFHWHMGIASGRYRLAVLLCQFQRPTVVPGKHATGVQNFDGEERNLSAGCGMEITAPCASNRSRVFNSGSPLGTSSLT